MKLVSFLLFFIQISCLFCTRPICGCLGPQNDIIIQCDDKNEKPIFDSLDPTYIHNHLVLYYIIDDKVVRYTDV